MKLSNPIYKKEAILTFNNDKEKKKFVKIMN